MTDSKLLQRLQEAEQCCDTCGQAYGQLTTGMNTCWHGVCDVCGLVMTVTSTRDYGYLQQGIVTARKADACDTAGRV